MLKKVSTKVQKYIPISERRSSKPTTICFTPMTKAAFDEYTYSLVEIKKNKITMKTSRAGEMLFRQCLAPDEHGVFIYNVIFDDVEMEKITDKEMAVKFLLGLTDLDTANEIEQVMRGSSTLSEEEEKNSDGLLE